MILTGDQKQIEIKFRKKNSKKSDFFQSFPHPDTVEENT